MDSRTNVFMKRLVLISLALSLMPISSCGKPPRHLVTADAPVSRPTPGAGQPININTASLSELEKLPGIGEVLAGRILAYRKEHGPFRRVEHLMMVRGLSDRKFREIRSRVTIE